MYDVVICDPLCIPFTCTKLEIPSMIFLTFSLTTPIVLYRLEENYEIAEGVCIPRSALYMHYLDFSEKHDTQPVNAASFGKVRDGLHTVFPTVSGSTWNSLSDSLVASVRLFKIGNAANRMNE